jgi:exosortase O
LYFFKKTLLWIFDAYILYENTLGLAVLISVIALLVLKFKKNERKGKALIQFKIRKLPFILLSISIPLYILCEYYIDLNILSSVIFGIGTYGLVGLYIPLNHWKRGFLPALLLIQTLPFGTNLDTYLGFPLRMFTTDLVTHMLSFTGIENLQNETIIIVENRAANIDLSCSGMKGLWSGTIFFFLAVWIENRKINLYTVFVFFSMILLLILFNIARITLLIYLDIVYDLANVADKIHLPTGIIGFVFSLTIVWLLLRNKSNRIDDSIHNQKKVAESSFQISHYSKKTILFSSVLIVILIAFSFIQFHKEETYQTYNSNKIVFPNHYSITPIRLSEAEKKLLLSQTHDYAEKLKFTNDTISGSLLLARTINWRSHHKPELCYQSIGFKTDISKTIILESNFEVRELTFSNSKQTAYYWFQSNDVTKSDFSSRIWDSVLGKQKDWTMVSVLFREKLNPQNTHEFLIDMKNIISQSNTKQKLKK